MQCETFEARLNQLLDRRRHPELDDELKAHALCCSSCQQMLDTQSMLFGALAPPAPAGDDAPLPEASQVVKQSLDAAQRRANNWYATLALLMIVGCSIAYWNRPQSQLSGNSIAGTQPVPETSPLDVRLAGLDEPQIVTDQGSGKYLGNLAATFPEALPTVESLEQMDHVGITRGLRPIASSFRTVFVVIRKTIPVGRNPRTDTPQAEYHPGNLTVFS